MSLAGLRFYPPLLLFANEQFQNVLIAVGIWNTAQVTCCKNGDKLNLPYVGYISGPS